MLALPVQMQARWYAPEMKVCSRGGRDSSSGVASSNEAVKGDKVEDVEGVSMTVVDSETGLDKVWTAHHDQWQRSQQYKWQSTLFRPEAGLALWVRHKSAIVAQKKLSSTSSSAYALVTGGGSLCFSFGTYYSPSFFLQINTRMSRVTDILLWKISRGEGSSSLNAHALWTALTQFTDICNVRDIPMVSSSVIHAKTKNFVSGRSEKDEKVVVTTEVSVRCSVCNEGFPSKNQLFKHIVKWGHQKVDALVK
jgi:hypothetical protein